MKPSFWWTRLVFCLHGPFRLAPSQLPKASGTITTSAATPTSSNINNQKTCRHHYAEIVSDKCTWKQPLAQFLNMTREVWHGISNNDGCIPARMRIFSATWTSFKSYCEVSKLCQTAAPFKPLDAIILFVTMYFFKKAIQILRTLLLLRLQHRSSAIRIHHAHPWCHFRWKKCWQCEMCDMIGQKQFSALSTETYRVNLP